MKKRIVVVSGSRGIDYVIAEDLIRCLIGFTPLSLIDEVWHGGCPKGVDLGAKEYAEDWAECDEVVFPADWKKHGKAAGPIRNKKMINAAVQAREEGADVLFISIWDGKSPGTKNCTELAEKAGLPMVKVEVRI